MEAPDTTTCFVDDLLDFASDIGEEDDDEDKPRKAPPPLNPRGHGPLSFNLLGSDDPGLPSSEELAEEDLEWISNKDAFPAVETFVEILSEHPRSISKHHSPVSVLEGSTTSSLTNSTTNSSTLVSCCGSLKFPVRARSKRHQKRRSYKPCQLQLWWSRQQATTKNVKPVASTATIGRKCQHCGSEKTPQWRAGPLGPKTLCNACGVRYKSGRLVPEYRPASSPSFSAELHSNSHRKILEMRKQKHTGMGMVVTSVDKG
ncbi:hypothetical protein I3843_01G197700 [Carya illinoinensis]|uniref:GATA-type domain-containing protein n=1 Tax=Carya illinoinensis TaxID=32201 RepID=A0A8T1RQA4_CARIL|nr:GATA transcription factor 1 [Carya illinoinensis]KAG6668908.1 hypothetical protein CIPAW_01G205200 [Carya illinoinensis]KAG6668909.1 hypothetical protein CIPAW_01G205200 [Carya illinoinensis]KAG6733004.1 hypothetical protein I3842_01G205100 [Carya illinoinensis]KAG7997152.1 hypothetical protein I3843_01G197700 [Carya illinoinensis]